MYYKEVYIDEIGDFDWDDLDEDEIGCVRYLVDMYEQEDSYHVSRLMTMAILLH